MTHEELLLFGERVRKSRMTLSLTQEHVANEIGISLRFYQMVERGEKNISLDTLLGISKTLNISVDYLLMGNMSAQLPNPIAEIFENLSPRHKADMIEILRLYANACNDTSKIS